ncbi:CubicO group peptidase, beta-lactamase class C family [Pedobacter westerhofensis]|uniref:CubicO group peptidase, beta-lactamase class C family n=1 Tax=Pedobacter westerhofensis TaxID=425512 RepID=A0A521E8I6_9SPHI|nr:serine hydrolase domain-containing protein [Pedobacter westerhofensis]SMO80092.1 CubicO group peptidase, beta-lactamase class C family [Pedobacter westerhofensis]
MTFKFYCVILFVTASIHLSAQSYQPAVFTDQNRLQKIAVAFPVIDQLYKEYAEKNHIPGMVYGIVMDGKLVHTGNTGYADIAHQVPANPESDFRIASMTKSFTAMAVLKLRDEGKLKLDDPVGMYIPEMQNMKYPTKDASEVTVRHLLTHAAGYPEDNPWGDRQLADTDEELLAIYQKGVSFSNDPGLGYEYSNLGFATLGYLIKKVSGIPYQDYITENILKPLGMTHTYWEYTKVPKEQLAHGYRWINNGWEEQPLLHDGSYGAMGGLITTIEDFSKYMALHLSAWPPRDDQELGPVKRSSVREMQYPWNIYALNANTKTAEGVLCPTVNAYAYGIRWTKDCNDRITIGHTGGLPGFGSQWAVMPEYGIGIVAFANATYARAGIINTQALETLLSVSALAPRQLPASAILNQRKDELMKILPEWNNAGKSGLFAQNFFLDYFSAQLKAEALKAFSQAGKIRVIHKIVAENQLRGYFIVEGTNANIRISFTLTPENPALIQEYHLELLSK